MSSPSVFEDAAARLRVALENAKLDALQTSDFRIFIHEAATHEIPVCIIQQASDCLLTVIQSNQLTNNNLIVAATAYCKLVSNIYQEPDALFEFFTGLLSEKPLEEWTLFVCHGIFQLNCWKKTSENGSKLLQEIFCIVKKFCRDLTSTCYLCFKVLHSFLTKIHELYPNGDGISEENFKAVLDIVLSNWENPLNGVRQQNSFVLNQLLLFNQDYWKEVLAKAKINEVDKKVSGYIKHECLLELTLTELSWTVKSKYFLLTSIVQDSNVSQIMILHGEDIIDGLLTSLSIPYLVSAGTDLYLALLESLTLEDWQLWFLKPFCKVVSQKEPSLEVENIFNYWMNQTLKKWPAIFEDLIEETKDALFSYISLYKIGRKEGFTSWNKLDEEKFIASIEHHSDKIRSQAFSLLCVSSKTSSLPCEKEFDAVQLFLKTNVNSDNSALRQNLLKSMTEFILRIRDVMLYEIKNKKDISAHTCPWNSCCKFLNCLHSFLLFNLEDKLNYQRKITTLEIYRMVLTYFGEEKERNNSYKRKSNKDNLKLRDLGDYSQSILQFESEEDKQALLHCLFHEDNSIRSSAANILMVYYQLTEANKLDFESLFTKATTLCSDQMFYKAESGALISQVLVTLAYKSPYVEFKNIINNGYDSFISVLLNSAAEQFSKLQDDLLKAASQGAFLYGTLQTIELLVADISVPDLSLNKGQLDQLLSLLERVSDYFIRILALKSDSSSGYAPSFGEMGMAIAAVVESSSVKCTEFSAEVGDDSASELQLTPAQQLVLSCIWLNLKECCKLSSLLVSQDMSVQDCQRCVSLVVSVLRRCRHKGAIESAGVALSHITAHLTRSCEPELVNLPEMLLKDFLHMLVDTTAATVSRRSAGLAILVHRLITGDSRPKKPLLHFCVSRLLTVAEDSNVPDPSALVDLPQSQALHFLRTLVQESSLREHMAQYTLKISLVALNNLASPLWTIRNAALQLFGALVPKLVGQKPNQDQNKGNHYLVFEELHTHAQPLVEMMLSELTSAAESDSMISHSKLMPLLTLVTNLTLGLQTVLTEDLTSITQKFQQCFKKLFKSNIFNVRKLSSKAHALFVTSSRLSDMIDKTVVKVIDYIEGRKGAIESENELHGYVLNLTHLFDRFEEDKVGMKVLLRRENEVHTLLETLGHKLLSAQCSYFTKALIFELNFPITFVETVALPVGNCIKYSLGYSHYINKKFKYAFFNLNDKEVERMVNFCLLKNPNYDVHYSCLKALKVYAEMKNIKSVSCNALLITVKEYLLFQKHNLTLDPLIFEVLLSLMKGPKCSNLANSEHFFCPQLLSLCLNALSSDDYSTTVITALLPVTSALLSAQNPVDLDALTKLSFVIKERSDTDCDQDMKLSAAKSLCFLTGHLKNGELKKNKSGELIWTACVELLQDEIQEVRYETNKFVSLLIPRSHNCVLNPYICHEYIFHYELALKFMMVDKLVHCLRKKILFKSEENNQTTGITNPFYHGVKSIYAEEKWVSQLALKCLFDIRLCVKDLDEHLKHLVQELSSLSIARCESFSYVGIQWGD